MKVDVSNFQLRVPAQLVVNVVMVFVISRIMRMNAIAPKIANNF